MRDFAISIDIAAPPARVHAVISDIERWHEWTSTVRSIRKRDPGPLRVGTRAFVRQPKLPPAFWSVSEVHEGHGFTWVTRSPGVTVIARHVVEPTPAGSRATLSIRFDGLLGGLVGRMTAGLNTRYLGIEAAGLKARSEQT
jgi:hypothetical protein